jgi:hypothetical protein
VPRKNVLQRTTCLSSKLHVFSLHPKSHLPDSLVDIYRGLSTILMSGNITTYPNLCAKVTASFSVLSDTINSVKSSVDYDDGEDKQDNGRNEIFNFITHLQKFESEKLSLTAALHLERLRLRNLRLGDGYGEGCDEVTMKLLMEGIRSLENRIASVVESINDVLDELRCIAME